MINRRVVLTGTGLYCPTAQTPAGAYASWIAGRSAFSTFPEGEGELVRFRGRCENLEICELPDRKVQKVVTRRDIIGLIVAMKAAKAAGIPGSGINPERFAMYVGASSTQIGDLGPYTELIAKSAANGRFDGRVFGEGLLGMVNPMVMMQNLMNNTLCYASIALDIRGVNANFVDFQAAGLRAVGEAYASLRDGRADIALAGGVSVSPDHYHEYEGVTMGFLQDSRRHDGEAQVRSFDASGCGTILSEGSAFVVLETLDHAIKRGARILAEVVGFATASEAGFAYVDHRKPDGLEDCVGRLVANAQQERIVDIIGIGNGIASEDFGELCAYEAVGKASGQKMRVTSIRPSTGELSESSGVASLVIATEGMQAGRFSGVHRFNRTVEPLKQIEIPTKEYSTSNHAIITARGFNGVSCALHIQMFTG